MISILNASISEINLSGVMVQIEKGAYSVGSGSVKGKVC
jgi:hypothetical protein